MHFKNNFKLIPETCMVNGRNYNNSRLSRGLTSFLEVRPFLFFERGEVNV
jgi:hypothetical protein